MLPRRKIDPFKAADMGDPWMDPEFAETYPVLFWFLSSNTYSDGTARATGGISIFVKYTVLSMYVNDNDRAVSALVKAGTWSELFQLAEDGIKADTLPWKSNSRMAPQQKPPF